MTRKDYILIADALRGALKTEIEVNGNNSGTAGGVRLAAGRIANSLEIFNPRFDREHFLAVVRGEKKLNSRPSKAVQS